MAAEVDPFAYDSKNDEDTPPVVKIEVIARVICDREIVIMPAPAGSSHDKTYWPKPNIAFFKSTGESNGKFKGIFANTFFPMLGCFVNDETTPIDPSHQAVLSKNYIVKLGGTFPTIFRGDLKSIPIWIIEILLKYLKHKLCDPLFVNLTPPIIPENLWDNPQLQALKQIYDELFLIYTCLSTYFSSEWQVYLSIALSNTTGEGVWVKEGRLKLFADFLFVTNTIQQFTVTPLDTIDPSDPLPLLYNYLVEKQAQCNFKSIPVHVKIVDPPTILYKVLTRDPQIVDQQIRICEKQQERESRKKSRTGGKSKKKRKIKRKSKSRKYKN